MADIFHLDLEQRALVELLDIGDNLTGEEQADLDKRIAKITEQKGNLLPQMFDTIEYLVTQNNAGQEKVSEIQALMKRNKRTIDRVMSIVKHIFVSTGQDMFDLGNVIFKRRKLPPRLEVIDPDAVPEDYKTVSITIPLHEAKIIAFEHPELNLDIDDSKAEVKKTEIKRLWKEEGIEMQGCKLINDDFKVEAKGV